MQPDKRDAAYIWDMPDALLQADEIQSAIDYGIDIQALIDNLMRSPEERIRRHQIALNTVERLREARPL